MGYSSFPEGEAAVSSVPSLAIVPIELDVISDSSICKAFTTLEEKFGHLDILALVL